MSFRLEGCNFLRKWFRLGNTDPKLSGLLNLFNQQSINTAFWFRVLTVVDKPGKVCSYSKKLRQRWVLSWRKVFVLRIFTAPIQVTVLSWAWGSSTVCLQSSSVEIPFGHFSSGRSKKAWPFSQRLLDVIDVTGNPLLPPSAGFNSPGQWFHWQGSVESRISPFG